MTAPSTIIGLSAHLNDTKKLEDKPKPKQVETIKRRHSFNFMMKFLSSRKNLFTISESSEDVPIISASFTAGASPTKPTQRKVRRGKRKSVVQQRKTTIKQSLETALSIVAQRSSGHFDNWDCDLSDSRHTSITGFEDLKDASTVSTLSASLESSQNSITTCSTASLTDDDSIYANRLAKEEAAKERRRRSKTQSPKSKKKRAQLLLPKEAPLIRGEMRWCESHNIRTLKDDDYHYTGVLLRRTMIKDVAPVMPVRTRD